MVHPLSYLAIALALAIPAAVWLRRIPIVYGLISANFAIFILTILTADYRLLGSPAFIVTSPITRDLAFTPVHLVEGNPTAAWTVFTAMFVHASVLHVVLNMVVLFMAGAPFEERVGRGRFLAIYAFTGVTAVLLHTLWLDLTAPAAALSVPLVGASGAVFGILAAFATMHPHDRIPFWLVFLVLPRVPVIIGATVMMMLEGAALFLGPPSNVANAAHLGGAIGGVVIGLAIRKLAPVKQKADTLAIDLDALRRRVTEPRQELYLDRIREHEDHPETQMAWIERLAHSLRCRTCDEPYEKIDRKGMRCPNGHQDTYDQA
jgi:membrane associated rhomboid family serine protease